MRMLVSALAAALVCTPTASFAFGRPILVPPAYAPPAPAAGAETPKGPRQVCKVQLADVRDARPDPSMGMMGLRPVSSQDSVAWVRAALQSLGKTANITIVEGADAPDLVLRTELVKSYMVLPLGTAKSANVVLGVRYGEGGAKAYYRGANESMNWNNGDGETIEALNRALAGAIDNLRADIVARCDQPPLPPPTPAPVAAPAPEAAPAPAEPTAATTP